MDVVRIWDGCGMGVKKYRWIKKRSSLSGSNLKRPLISIGRRKGGRGKGVLRKALGRQVIYIPTENRA